MNTDKLNKLQQIAEGSVYTGRANNNNFSELKATKLKTKLKSIEDGIKQMYPKNKEQVFKTWVQATKEFPLPTKEFKDYYWNKYLDLHPEGKDVAKKEMISRAELEMKMFETPTEKEYYLREQIARWPNWMANEFKDDLQNFSTRNADVNLNKAKQVYKDDLTKRLNKLSSKELDPDVPEEVHTNDLLKLERMNLLDVANAINGRFGVANKEGSFVPAND